MADNCAIASCDRKSCSTPSVPNVRHNWPSAKPVNKAPWFTTMASIACRSSGSSDFAVGSRHRKPYPAGSRARGWGDGLSPDHRTQSQPARFCTLRGLSLVPTQNWDRSELWPRSHPRDVGRDLLLVAAFLIGILFSRDRILSCLYTHVSYPARHNCRAHNRHESANRVGRLV